MKYKKSWGTFFAATTGLAIGGMTSTALLAKKACGGVFHNTENLVNTVLNTVLGFSGTLQMDVNMPGSDMTVPIASKNLLIGIHMDLNEQLIQQMKAFPSIAESLCEKEIWNTGFQATTLLLLASAGICTVAFIYKKSQAPDLRDIQPDEENGYASMKL